MSTPTPGKTIPPRAPDASAFAGRDRVLLFTRGMDIDPVDSVDLALESLKRAGENASPEKVMRECYAILDERFPRVTLTNPDGSMLTSAPPMNRRTMIARDMDQFSLTAPLVRFLRKIIAAILPLRGQNS